jgi:hypothetical protein
VACLRINFGSMRKDMSSLIPRCPRVEMNNTETGRLSLEWERLLPEQNASTAPYSKASVCTCRSFWRGTGLNKTINRYC